MLEKKESILADYEMASRNFIVLLDSLSENDMAVKSRNPGWTNGEILAHILFGFIILNALLPMARIWAHFPKWASRLFARLLNLFTGPFNWVNALGARFQGHIFTFKRIGKLFGRVYISLQKQINSIQENEWDKGMFYPTRWDSNFAEFMTVEKLLRYPIVHFNFHLKQIKH